MSRSIAALALMLAVAFPASAAERQKPGLWEVTLNVDLGGAAPQLPPEALAQMKQLGLKLPGVEPIVQKVCITPEQAMKEAMPSGTDPNSGCTVKNVKQDGNRHSADLECAGEMKGKGSVVMTLNSSESYNGTTKFKGAGANGTAVDTSTDISGRWLGSDCKGVTPIKG